MRASLLASLLCAAGTAASAAEATSVISDHADAVSVTVYRRGFALITETRTVDLPAGPLRLVFRNVADTLLPQSAVLDGQNRALASTDFRDNPLTARTLLQHSVGSKVQVTRTDRATGRVVTSAATIVAANEGIVLQIGDGAEALYCSGLPEQLSFSRIPDGLTATPELSVDLAGGQPGPRTLRVSYLASGFSWSAEYRATLDPEAGRMRLMGWMTLQNSSGMSFRNAEVQVVAGELNLVDEREGGTAGSSGTTGGDDPILDRRKATPVFPVRVLSDCYDLGRTRGTSAASNRERRARASMESASPIVTISDGMEEVQVTGSRIVQRESLGDYQLYRLPERTDLLARQEKQLAFLRKDDVRVERLYALRLGGQPGMHVPRLQLQTRNDAKSGLGEPLPQGTFWLFETGPSGTVLAGESALPDKAVGLPVEITFDSALDLMVEVVGQDEQRKGQVMWQVSCRILSAKALPVQLELRQDPLVPDSRIVDASQRPKRKYGDFVWRLNVPANGETRLQYKLKAPLREDEAEAQD